MLTVLNRLEFEKYCCPETREKRPFCGRASLNVESLGPDEVEAHSIRACVVIQEGCSVKRIPAF